MIRSQARSYVPPLPERGSDRFPEVASRDQVPLRVNGNGKLGQRPGGGTENRLRTVGREELGLVARAEDPLRLRLVQRGGAAQVGADLRVGVVVAVVVI